jgi:hypothetical protein
MSHCCESANSGKFTPLTPKVREFLAWLLPSAVLVVVPKCPACLAAYVALWTGLGLSLTTAANLRWAMVLPCVASLLFLSVKRLSRSTITWNWSTHFSKEQDKCEIQ